MGSNTTGSLTHRLVEDEVGDRLVGERGHGRWAVGEGVDVVTRAYGVWCGKVGMRG